MLKYLIGALIAGLMLTTAPAAHADDAVTIAPAPQWGTSDVPPMSVAVKAIAWRKVVTRRYCLKTVKRTWERHGKGRWVLVSKRTFPHHEPIEGCRRDRR